MAPTARTETGATSARETTSSIPGTAVFGVDQNHPCRFPVTSTTPAADHQDEPRIGQYNCIASGLGCCGQAAPTSKQLAFLRTLSRRTGTTFTSPATCRQASRAIQALLQRPLSTQLELELDYAALRGGDLPEAA